MTTQHDNFDYGTISISVNLEDSNFRIMISAEPMIQMLVDSGCIDVDGFTPEAGCGVTIIPSDHQQRVCDILQ